VNTNKTNIRQAPKPAETAYVKLFTLLGAQPYNDASDDVIEFIARNYAWINSHGGSWLRPAYEQGRTREKPALFAGPSGGVDARGRTVGQRLREINPDIILTNYRNATPTSQHAVTEAREVESTIPLAILVHDTMTTLDRSLSASDTEVWIQKPSDKPDWIKEDVYPFKASSTSKPYSLDKDHYVAWIRLENEILRIVKAESTPEDLIRLTVRRGFWGTTAVTHQAGSTVFQPVYCGIVRRGERQWEGENLGGSPDQQGQASLRYLMMVQKPVFWKWLAEKSREILEQGYNGPWFDCTCSMWINHANAYGVQVPPYDFDKQQELIRDDFRLYHQMKLDYMFETFPEGEFYVNWIWPQYYFDNGIDRLLFSGANGHHPISGGAVEMYGSFMIPWVDTMKLHRDLIDNNYRAVFWKKGEDSNEFNLFAYGSYLLMQEPTAPHCFGGRWNEQGPYGLFTPPSFLFWDLGKPLEQFRDISEAELPGHPGVYRRRYSKGMVVVNPSWDDTFELALEEDLYEPITSDWVEKVTLEPRRARLLLSADS
jgi:hypothetical protein